MPDETKNLLAELESRLVGVVDFGKAESRLFALELQQEADKAAILLAEGNPADMVLKHARAHASQLAAKHLVSVEKRFYQTIVDAALEALRIVLGIAAASLGAPTVANAGNGVESREVAGTRPLWTKQRGLPTA